LFIVYELTKTYINFIKFLITCADQEFSEDLKSGNVTLASLPDMIQPSGSIPIIVDGYLITAVE